MRERAGLRLLASLCPGVRHGRRTAAVGGRAKAMPAAALAEAVALAAALTLAWCSGARGDDLRFGEYVTLGQLERKPAPLVPISLPPTLEAGVNVGTSLLSGANGTYSLSYKHIADLDTPREHVDENLLLEDLGTLSVAKRRATLGPAVVVSPTRVRGHRGVALRTRFTGGRSLLWNEDGRLYELGTATPSKVSMAELQKVASDMQHLLGSFSAELTAADGSTKSVEAVVAEHAVDLYFEWDAACSQPGVEFTPARGAAAAIGWLRLSGGAFPSTPFSATSSERSARTWQGTVGGTASAAGGTITFQASSTVGAESCSTPPTALLLTLLPRFQKAA